MINPTVPSIFTLARVPGVVRLPESSGPTKLILRRIVDAPLTDVSSITEPVLPPADHARLSPHISRLLSTPREIDFRKSVRDLLLDLPRDIASAVFTRAMRYRRSLATFVVKSGEPTELVPTRHILRPHGPPNVPRQPHRLPLRGRADPVVHTRQSVRREVPPGSVHIRRSTARRRFVRAMKMEDGSWKILGYIGEPIDHDAPPIEHHEEHPDSIPHEEAEREITAVAKSCLVLRRSL